jgi:DNA-binding Xre family transcriptional regulator
MIRSENDYREAIQRLTEEKKRIARQKAKLETMSLAPDEVKRVLDPLRSFHLQLCEEIEHYEQLKRGEFADIRNLRGLGCLLIDLRIARGISQRQLAERLGVHESQISRDERNEYHGITLERAARVLDALGAELYSHVQMQAEDLAVAM